MDDAPLVQNLRLKSAHQCTQYHENASRLKPPTLLMKRGYTAKVSSKSKASLSG